MCLLVMTSLPGLLGEGMILVGMLLIASIFEFGGRS